MFVFVCTGCGAELTAPLSQVVLPVYARRAYGNGVQLPVLMERGTFAVDPEGWGRTAARPAAGGEDGSGYEAGAETGSVVVAPGDVRGAVLVPERESGACCGLDGSDGPNMNCAACGLPVGRRIDDCSLWQKVRLEPGTVRRRQVADVVLRSWATLRRERDGAATPPLHRLATWGPCSTASLWWTWTPEWYYAGAQALAHLLAASEGRPVSLPDGLLAVMFRPVLDAVLGEGPSPRRAVLAGPGLPAPGEAADILFVPAHPQTGETWPSEGRKGEREGEGNTSGAVYRVPLPFGVWLWLVSPEPYLPLPSSGVLPDGVLRDVPPAPRPDHPFDVDRWAFDDTLARLAEVRGPWLRELAGRLPPYVRGGA
ncbi:hypothetical protein [Streptomyces hydrogenans]|uniref:hypothetical protein n=1 Tax=Streptomyces hydrogenans TaxID=1873719 RepID=UPI0035DB355C